MLNNINVRVRIKIKHKAFNKIDSASTRESLHFNVYLTRRLII